MEIEAQAQRSGHDFRNGKGQPRVGQIDPGEEPEYGNQAEDLPGQGEQDAGQRRPDGLEKDRHDQGGHGGQKADADDVEGLDADLQDRGLRGENAQQLFRDQLEAGDPHQHEGHGQQDGVLHHPAAAAVGTLGVCIAQQGDDAGLESGEGDEEEGLHLVIQAQDRHGVIGKAGQDHVQGHDIDREQKLHEDGGKSQPVDLGRIGAEHPDGGRLPESGDNNERRQHLA